VVISDIQPELPLDKKEVLKDVLSLLTDIKEMLKEDI
jgi:hypothetical protein